MWTPAPFIVAGFGSFLVAIHSNILTRPLTLLAFFILLSAHVGVGHSKGFKLNGDWSLVGGTLGLASNGVPLGLELTQVGYDDGIWHGVIMDYRYTVGEDRVPHGISLGYELGFEFVGIEASATSLFGDGPSELGGRVRGCGVLFMFSLCGGMAFTNERRIWILDLAAKLHVKTVR